MWKTKFHNKKNLILPVRHFLGYFFPKKNILTSSLIRHLVYVSICCQAFGITRTILQTVPGENVPRRKRTQFLGYVISWRKGTLKNHQHNKKTTLLHKTLYVFDR